MLLMALLGIAVMQRVEASNPYLAGEYEKSLITYATFSVPDRPSPAECKCYECSCSVAEYTIKEKEVAVEAATEEAEPLLPKVPVLGYPVSKQPEETLARGDACASGSCGVASGRSRLIPRIFGSRRR